MVVMAMEGFEDHCVPLGYRFNPTEQELLSYYLPRKLLGFSDNTVPMCDLYGQTNPWDLWENLKESETFNGAEVYVFTKLKKKSVNGSRVDRSIGLGCWSGEDGQKAVYSCGDKLKIGSRKRFRFEKSGTDHDGGWILIEYSIEKSWLQKLAVNGSVNYQTDLVICKVKKNLRRQPKSMSIMAASSSSSTYEENHNKLKKRKQSDEVVSESNKRLRENGKAAESDESNGEYKVKNQVMAATHDPLSCDDGLKEFLQSLEKDLLHDNDQFVNVVKYDHSDKSKGLEYEVNNEVMVDDPFINFGDSDFEGLQNILKDDYVQPHYDVPLRSCAAAAEFLKFINVGQDNLKPHDYMQSITINEQVIFNCDQSQQWDDNNMYFDFDWLYKNHPDLAAPSMDDLYYMSSQTAIATPALTDANSVFYYKGWDSVNMHASAYLRF